MICVSLGWFKHVRKSTGWPQHNNKPTLFAYMQAQKADWVEMRRKTGGSHGSVYPVVKFVNAYDEIILDASDT